ncbi:MAG: hypothetical protein QHH04_08375 [Methanolinea sp.]|nr:hypothetical protein [Methanolinea sp.]
MEEKREGKPCTGSAGENPRTDVALCARSREVTIFRLLVSGNGSGDRNAWPEDSVRRGGTDMVRACRGKKKGGVSHWSLS